MNDSLPDFWTTNTTEINIDWVQTDTFNIQTK